MVPAIILLFQVLSTSHNALMVASLLSGVEAKNMYIMGNLQHQQEWNHEGIMGSAYRSKQDYDDRHCFMADAT